jgi:cyclophilin family peptidyl-prolyl cis-trans isomerase/HEAT repeat protein
LKDLKENTELWLLLKDKDWRVRVEAVRTLSRLDPESLKTHIESLLRDENPNVVVAAVASARSLEPNTAVPILRALAADPSSARGALAFIILSGLEKEALLIEARGLARSSDVRLRRIGATALSAIGTEKALAALLLMIDDPKPQVRAEVVASLGAFPKEDVLDILKRTAGTEKDYAVIAALAERLEGFEDAGSADLLRSRYGDLKPQTDVEGKLAIIDAVASLEKLKSIDFLKLRLSDPDLACALRASQRLRRLTGEDLRGLIGKRPCNLPFTVKEWDGASALIRTGKGAVTIVLYGKDAPVTVSNFISLAQKGFYRGLTFHRVVPDFVIQGGCPRADGSGGPGYSFPCEITRHRYRRGSVGMALSGKDTGGSQFFITHGPTPHLDGLYTLFGQVTEGQDVVDSISEGDRIEDIEIRLNAASDPGNEVVKDLSGQLLDQVEGKGHREIDEDQLYKFRGKLR